MSEKQPQSPYHFDVLNNNPGQFRVMARSIDSSDEAMPGIRNRLEVETPGLAMHVGAWIPHLESYALHNGQSFADKAILGYNKGALMTFDLLNRVAQANGKTVPNPQFNPDDFADSEWTAPLDNSLLSASMRGRYLPDRFPAIFKSAMTMLGIMYKQPPAIMERRVHQTPSHMEDVFIAHFLTGAAEVVLPLERYAEASYLEQQLKLE
jgi:hypothetical protein